MTKVFSMTGWDRPHVRHEFETAADALHSAASYLEGWMNDNDRLQLQGRSRDDCHVVVVTEHGEDTDAHCRIERIERET